MSGEGKTFVVMTSTLSRGTLVSVVSLFAATLYQENPDMNHKLWNSVSTLTLILILTQYQENPDMNHKLWNIVSTLTLTITLTLTLYQEHPDMNHKLWNIVSSLTLKPAHAVTSDKQLPVCKGRPFLSCHRNFHMI